MSILNIIIKRFGTASEARRSLFFQCVDNPALRDQKEFPRCLDGRICCVRIRQKDILCVVHVEPVEGVH